MKFLKGLNRDTDPIDQPAGTWRYAKNIVIEPNSSAIQSEHGTESIINITNGYFSVGHIVLQDDTTVIFSVLPDTTNPQTAPGTSEIGVFDPINGTYTVIFNDWAQIVGEELNFRREYPIQGEHKIDGTGRVSIYWTDDNSSMKFLKIYNALDPLQVPNTGTPYDIELFNIFPLIQEAPIILLNRLIGGVLNVGAYALAIALVSDEGTPTNYINISNWVYVNDSSEVNAISPISASNPYNSPGGSTLTSNLSQHGQTDYNGAPVGSSSGKGIIWDVTNLDNRYSFMRPAILIKEGGTVTAVLLPDRDYDANVSTIQSISYTGNEITQAVTVTEILIPRESYTQAKTVAQVDDVLYWGNLERTLADIGYQPFANSIIVQAQHLNANFSDTGTVNGNAVDWHLNNLNSTRDAVGQYYYRGYQRDETYAIYIAWILKDGNETVAYHIPGRAAIPLTNHAGTTAPFPAGVPESARVSDMNGAFTLPVNSETVQLGNPMLGKIHTYGAIADPNGMGFWENETENYPTDDNFDIWTIAGGVEFNTGNTLQGLPVRHHHFPSSGFGEGGQHIWDMRWQGNNRSGRHVINPLGFRLQNVPITQAIIDNCVAYKIYYAYRDEANTTVVDTGIFNLTPSYHGRPSAQAWGSTNINNWNTCTSPVNGINISCLAGNVGPAGVPTLSTPPNDYLVQAPPDMGGEVVAFPHSAVAAPQSNAAPFGWGYNDYRDSMQRESWISSGNHMTFNGLHIRVNDPDISNLSYIKPTRHLRIGRWAGTGSNAQMRGFTFMRHDEQRQSTARCNRHHTFIDWSLMPPEEYGHHTNMGMTNITIFDDVEQIAPNAAPTLYSNIRSLKGMRNLPAGQTVSVPGATVFNNIGGCQTTALATDRHIWAHDFGRTMHNYYMYKILRMIDPYTIPGGGNLFNGVSFWNESHNFMMNHEDNWGQGFGTWAFIDCCIGNPDLMSVATAWGVPSPYWPSDQDIWCGTFWTWWICSPHTTCAATVTGDIDGRVVQFHAYGGIHRQFSDLHTPFDLVNNFVFTGHTEDTTAFTTMQLINPTSVIMGGDTYINLYTETRGMSQNGWAYFDSGPTGSSQGPAAWFANDCTFPECLQRRTHYTYGIYGDGWRQTYEDIAQQLYITESKVNVVNRHTDGNPNEDYFPAVDRQDAALNTWVAGPRLYSYNADLGALMNVYPVIVFNYKNRMSSQTDFPTRIIRSVKYNRSGLVDNFRIYLPSQYRDLPRHRGELWNLAVYDNVLLPQTERALFKTKGKETLQTGEASIGDISEIALGDGDLFTHDPSEVLYTKRGWAGTLSQFGVVVTRYGHLSVDKLAGKVFLLGEKLEEISSNGLREFLYRRLTTWGLQAFGLPDLIDMPTMGIGIIATWDPKYNRFIITKLDKEPTTIFITGWNIPTGTVGKIIWDSYTRHYVVLDVGGSITSYIEWSNTLYFYDRAWTLSYYPELKYWGAVHDYTPNMYFYTTSNFYSMIFNSSRIWEHDFESGDNSTNVIYNIGRYYNVDYDIVFEYIDNLQPEDNKIYSNFYYTVDVDIPTDREIGSRHPIQDPGFNYFYVYNSRQLTWGSVLVQPAGSNLTGGATTVRRKERTWYVNGFRDNRLVDTPAAGTTLDAPMDTPILTTNHLTADVNMNMGSVGGKPWNEMRKFADKWIAVRLLQTGTQATGANSKFLVSLHSADTSKRKIYR